MELRHLRYFAAVAEVEHVTQAAERLHVSQPSLSQQVRQLEAELGVPLLDRVGKRVRLTEAGQLFRDYATRILALSEAAALALRELEGLSRGRVRLGVVQTVKAYLVPRVLAAFHRAHPDVFVGVEELSAQALEAGLREGTLDLGVGFVPGADPLLASESLFSEELVLVLNRRHPLASRRRLRLEELEGLPLVLLPEAFCTRRLFDRAAAAEGLVPNVSAEINSISGIQDVLRGIEAGSVLPALALGRGDKDLCAVRLASPLLKRSVGLLWHRQAYRSAGARVLAATLRQEAAKGPGK